MATLENPIQQEQQSAKPASGHKKNPKRSLLWFSVAAAAGALTLAIAPATGLEAAGQKALATLVFMIVLWMTEAVDYPVSVMFLLVLMTWAGMGPKVALKDSFKTALSGFAGTVPITVIAGTALAAVVQSTGLAERMVYGIIRLVGGANATAKRVLAAMFIADIPFAFLVPSATGRSALYLSIVEGLRNPFGFKQLDKGDDGNPFQKAAYIAAAVIPVIMGAAFLTGAEATLMAGRLIETGTKVQQTWGGTFTLLFLPAVAVLVITWFVLTRVFPATVEKVSIEFVHNRLAAMGRMSYNEKYVLVVLLSAISLWVTDKFHGIPAEVVLILAPAILFIPGVGPGNWKRDSKAISWGAFMVIALATSFATQLDKTGVMKMFASWLGSFGATSFLGIMLIMVLTTVVLRLGMASITAAATLFIPLAITLGKSAGLGAPALVALGWIVYVFCRAGYLLPQQTAQLMMVYDYNFFNRRDLLKAGALMTGATLVVYGLWSWLAIPVILG